MASLSAFWQHRIEKGAPRFGLTPIEYNVHLILIYTGEVGNGGHSQFLMNRGVDHVTNTVTALGDIGLFSLGDLLEQAAVEFTSDTPLSDTFDAKSYDLTRNVDRVLQRYCHDHMYQILRLERGLAPL